MGTIYFNRESMRMKRWQARIALIILISLLMVLLAGCVKFRLHLTVNRDGTANMEITVAAHPSLATMGILWGGDMLAEVREGLLAEGFSVEEYTDGDFRGFKAKKALESVDDVAFLSMENPKVSHDYFVLEKGLFYSTYHVAIPVNLVESYGEAGAVFGFLNPDLGFILSLPVRPLDHNADIVSDDGKTLEWKLHLDRENHLQVSFRTPNTLSILLIVVLGVILISICLYRYRAYKNA
jgi:hypothetical protein